MGVVCRMAAEVEAVRTEEKRERDAAITAAVAAAKKEWQSAQQKVIQVCGHYIIVM